MKYTKVIILTINKFDQRDFHRFGVNELLLNNIFVNVYDLTSLLRTPHYIQSYNPTEEIKEDYVYKIKDLFEFRDLLNGNNCDSTFIICYIPLYQKTESIFQIISVLRFRYVVYRMTLPDLRPLYKQILSRLLFLAKYHLLRRNIQPAAIVLYAGYQTRFQNSSKIAKKTIKIDVGSIDFNNYSEIAKKGIKTPNSPEIVFIDEYYPLHPDLENERFIDPSFYYKAVNKFLHEVAEKYKMSCGIAVHPRADYFDKNPFEFELYFEQTAELIYNSRIVVGHASTAFSFAVLGNKPIIQLGFKQTIDHFYGKVLKSFSKQLGLQTCFLDESYSIPDLKINFRKYKKYIYNYLIVDREIGITNANTAFLNYILNDANC